MHSYYLLKALPVLQIPVFESYYAYIPIYIFYYAYILINYFIVLLCLHTNFIPFFSFLLPL